MSAKNIQDYVGGEGTLAFSHGETQKILEITILESDVRKFNVVVPIPFVFCIVCNCKGTA